MNRVILSPAELPTSALAELKQWLGITTCRDDAALSALLAMALETCEGFTGQMPLECGCEEVLAANSGWHTLATRPVLAITTVEDIAADGSRLALGSDGYAIELDADGTGRVRLPLTATTGRIAVRFTAGLAPMWEALPDSIRHGVIRLAAHQHRQREGDGAAPLPPASVAALWRPWRRLRLR
ncbi:hypothetical protein WSK_3169 [Novosphingobium sp. Rr 2-17]|uniref:head-tail connector protein n=1 Tax=Novosphingobium sp. Rr 2-17 TaxID=555793 RepID=UPI000269855E|nr:hypothetical protein [Novosphingobium sp. Rr 2-17]EIZ78287.1 hypothetical protein WSK_3169 [Novosphingobium sp. Rr 2-17]